MGGPSAHFDLTADDSCAACFLPSKRGDFPLHKLDKWNSWNFRSAANSANRKSQRRWSVSRCDSNRLRTTFHVGCNFIHIQKILVHAFDIFQCHDGFTSFFNFLSFSRRWEVLSTVTPDKIAIN
jgi:hypothetical protein